MSSCSRAASATSSGSFIAWSKARRSSATRSGAVSGAAARGRPSSSPASSGDSAWRTSGVCPDEAGVVLGVHLADPGEFAPVEQRRLVAEELLLLHGAAHQPDEAAILGSGVVAHVGERHAAEPSMIDRPMARRRFLIAVP